jgi:hypothetical protein
MVLSRRSRHRGRAATVNLAQALLATAIAGGVPTLAEEAHVHGEAVLEVSLAGPSLSVVLRGPAQVFFGFEHPPTDDEEARVVQAALDALQAPVSSVLELPPACELKSTDVDAPFPAQVQQDTMAAERAHHESHEHETHDHEADKHHHDDEAGESGHGGHSDLEVTYSYTCTAGSPDSLTLTAFGAFPALERVEAAWISDSAAGSAELTRRASRLSMQAP